MGHHKKKPKFLPDRLYHLPALDRPDLFTVLTEDVIAVILSFAIHYPSIGRSLAAQHKSLTSTCKAFRAATIRLHVGHIRDMTGGQWTKVPGVYTNTVLPDALRLGIAGVTKKTAKQLLLPDSVMETMTCSVVKLSRWCDAHVYPTPLVLRKLSEIFPTVDEYDTALETHRAVQEARHLTRLHNAQVRQQRSQEIRDLLTRLRVDRVPDPRLERLYVTNGSAKNLRLIEEGAKLSRIRQDRIEEVRRLQVQMQASSAQVPAETMKSYVETGDKGQPWRHIVEWIENAKVERSRLDRVNALLNEMNIPARTVNNVVKDAYIRTGSEEVWGQIVKVVTEQKDRRISKQQREADVQELAFQLADGEMWIRQVPMSYWRTHSTISNFIDQNDHGDDWRDAVRTLFEPVRKLQFAAPIPEGWSAASHSLVKYLRSVRRDDLTMELTKHGLHLRPDSKFCAQYIDGTTCASVQEVVATMKLTGYLFSNGGHRGWSHNHHRLENEMRSAMQDGRVNSWYEAYEEAKNLARFDDEDDSF